MSYSEFNKFRLKRYQEHWNLLETRGITTSMDYLPGALRSEQLPVSNPEDVVREILGDHFNESNEKLQFHNRESRHWLTRFYPYNDQEIFFGLQDPLLSNDPTKITSNEHIRLAQASLDPAMMSKISANYYVDYLAGAVGTNNKTDRFRTVLNALDVPESPIGNLDSQTEYFQVPTGNRQYEDRFDRQVDTTAGVFADFYFGNTWALGNFSDVSFKDQSSYKHKLHRLFIDEIDAVDPSLIILSGADPWGAVRSVRGDELEPALDTIEYPERLSGVDSVHGCLYEDQYDRLYLPIMHLQSRRKWHSEIRLRRSCEKAASRLS